MLKEVYSFIKTEVKTVSRILLTVGIASIIYGYWGAFTRSGNKVYDEMDAYLPFFILIAGVSLMIAFIILEIIMRRKKKR
jgi:ABC-type phosphate transport system permease subunit